MAKPPVIYNTSRSNSDVSFVIAILKALDLPAELALQILSLADCHPTFTSKLQWSTAFNTNHFGGG